jgi:hypothetical protein
MPEGWQDFWEAISVFQFAGWMLAALAVIGFIVKVWPFIRKLFALVDALGQLPEFIARTDTKIEQIHHEVHFNNGSSVKDAIVRVEKAVNEHVMPSLDVLTATDAEIRAELEATQNPKE